MFTNKYSNRKDFNNNFEEIINNYKLSHEIYPLITNVLTPFLGQKILKADGTFTQNVKNALSSFPTNKLWFIHPSHYSLVVYKQGKILFTVANIDNFTILKDFIPLPPIPPIFTLPKNEIIEHIKQAETLTEEYYNNIKQLEAKFAYNFTFLK